MANKEIIISWQKSQIQIISELIMSWPRADLSAVVRSTQWWKDTHNRTSFKKKGKDSCSHLKFQLFVGGELHCASVCVTHFFLFLHALVSLCSMSHELCCYRLMRWWTGVDFDYYKVVLFCISCSSFTVYFTLVDAAVGWGLPRWRNKGTLGWCVRNKHCSYRCSCHHWIGQD